MEISLDHRVISTPVLAGLTIFVVLWTPCSIPAHPMGNFSISHYAGIRVEENFIELRYLIDMAEIPTFQEIQQTGIVPKVGNPSLVSYLARKAEVLKGGLLLEVNGRPLALRLVSQDIIFPPGAGGLPTMKLGFLYRAKLDGVPEDLARLGYRDGNFPGHAGWKEVIATASRGIVFTSSSVPSRDRSFQLANYPTDLLNSPPQDLEARVIFMREDREPSLEAFAKVGPQLPPSAAGSDQETKGSRQRDRGRTRSSEDDLSVHKLEPANPNPGLLLPLQTPLGLQANQQVTPRNPFTELVATKELSLWVLFLGAAIAVGLGGLHALEPGHGKTLVAAYLVGSRGTASHACLLGLLVTASHTAGVYLLGAATLYASKYVVPERLYPWLGVISGLTIAGLGFYLFLRRYKGETRSDSHPHAHFHEHSHLHGHSHHHGEHEHHGHSPHAYHSHGLDEPAVNAPEGHGHHHHENGEKVSLRELLALGISGGIVPCPAALVVLLSAISLHRIALGLFLIVAFSVGLAAVLIAIGLMLVSAKRFMSRVQIEGPLITRWLPVTSAAFITILGVSITLQALVTGGILQIRF